MNLEKTFLKTFLKNFEEEAFEVEFWDGDKVIVGKETPKFTIKLNKPLKKLELLNSTSLAFGEAYMNGDVEFEGDLFLVLNTILKHMNKFTTNHKALPQIFHKVTNKSKQKEEVTSHYDIGNDFYSLWLDKTMSYSCGYFKDESDTLEQAQINKINHKLKKLNLKEGQSLLDIGCGWGK